MVGDRNITDSQLAQRLLLGCLFLAAYVALDYVSFVKPYRGLGITPWNPPPGLSIAVIYIGGMFYAPFVLIAPALADAIVRGWPLDFGSEILASLSVGGVYLSAGLVLRKIAAFDPRLRSVRDALVLIVIAVLSATAAAGFYIAILVNAGFIASGEVQTLTWRASVGDIIGILVVAPLVLLAKTYRPWPAPGLEAGVQLAALLCALAIVFGYREATAFQLFYLLFLPLLWIALTYGPPGVAVALALAQVGLIIGAEIRFGPDPGLSALQALMIALAITGLVVSAIVAEREDAAARLRDQQAALNRALRIRSAGEVAATIAHEINQPLTALTTYSGIADKALSDGKAELAHQVVQKIRAECVRATSILKGIRDLLHQGAVSPVPIDLRSMLLELRELLVDEFTKKGVRLMIRIKGDLAIVHADRVQLQQAIHNLILNSAEAIAGVGRQGRIEVSAAIDGHDLMIDVSDDGPGFPPGFNLADPTPFVTTKSEGSGIGLVVARSIAEAHGGSLKIVSSARGANVCIRLPLGREHG